MLIVLCPPGVAAAEEKLEEAAEVAEVEAQEAVEAAREAEIKR